MKLLNKVAMVAVLLSGMGLSVNADPIQWELPFGVGSVQFPFQTNRMVGGYDLILNKPIGGFSTDVAHFFRIFNAQVGAVGDPKENAVQPYLAAGIELSEKLPILSQYTNLSIDAFGRWDTTVGKAGAGFAASYRF